jgi:hypothetical protein
VLGGGQFFTFYEEPAVPVLKSKLEFVPSSRNLVFRFTLCKENDYFLFKILILANSESQSWFGSSSLPNGTEIHGS